MNNGRCLYRLAKDRPFIGIVPNQHEASGWHRQWERSQSWRWSQKAQNAGNGGKDRLQGLTGGDGGSGAALFNLVEQLSGGQDTGVLVAEIQAEGVGERKVSMGLLPRPLTRMSVRPCSCRYLAAPMARVSLAQTMAWVVG